MKQAKKIQRKAKTRNGLRELPDTELAAVSGGSYKGAVGGTRPDCPEPPPPSEEKRFYKKMKVL